MWRCTQCGREFKKNNQDHYCLAINAIDGYIAEQPEEVQPLLQKIRETIHAAAPEAEERISWRMPTFWQGRNIIHFAAFKNHIGLYPGDKGVAAFAEQLTHYKTSKGAIQLPLSKPLDYELIAAITRWNVAQLEAGNNE